MSISNNQTDQLNKHKFKFN